MSAMLAAMLAISTGQVGLFYKLPSWMPTTVPNAAYITATNYDYASGKLSVTSAAACRAFADAWLERKEFATNENPPTSDEACQTFSTIFAVQSRDDRTYGEFDTDSVRMLYGRIRNQAATCASSMNAELRNRCVWSSSAIDEYPYVPPHTWSTSMATAIGDCANAFKCFSDFAPAGSNTLSRSTHISNIFPFSSGLDVFREIPAIANRIAPHQSETSLESLYSGGVGMYDAITDAMNTKGWGFWNQTLKMMDVTITHPDYEFDITNECGTVYLVYGCGETGVACDAGFVKDVYGNITSNYFSTPTLGSFAANYVTNSTLTARQDVHLSHTIPYHSEDGFAYATAELIITIPCLEEAREYIDENIDPDIDKTQWIQCARRSDPNKVPNLIIRFQDKAHTTDEFMFQHEIGQATCDASITGVARVNGFSVPVAMPRRAKTVPSDYCSRLTSRVADNYAYMGDVMTKSGSADTHYRLRRYEDANYTWPYYVKDHMSDLVSAANEHVGARSGWGDRTPREVAMYAIDMNRMNAYRSILNGGTILMEGPPGFACPYGDYEVCNIFYRPIDGRLATLKDGEYVDLKESTSSGYSGYIYLYVVWMTTREYMTDHGIPASVDKPISNAWFSATSKLTNWTKWNWRVGPK